MTYTSFLEQFAHTFVAEPFRQLADQTGWRKRIGKIDPFGFIVSLVFGQLSASRQTLSSQAQTLAEPVSRQAIDQRFGVVQFLQASFAHVLAHTLDWSAAHPQAEALRANFSALYLLDSTAFDCPATLQHIFPACGGAGSSANAKVLLRCLLMPLPRCVTLWLSPAPDQPAALLDLASVLAASSENQMAWSGLRVGTSDRRLGPLRRVAFGLNLESAARQRQGLRESMRKRGGTPSAHALQLAGWLLLLTNAPEAKLPSSMMSYVYRLPWQVEWIFRQAKSVLRLDKTESQNPCRVPAEISARLICAILLFSWHAHASAECWRLHQCQASFEKLIRMMQHWGHTIARAFLGGPDALLPELRTLWKNLLVNARKGRQKSRPATWENLFNLWLNSRTTPV